MRNFIFLLLIISAAACTKSEFCIEPNTAAMVMSFKTYDSANEKVDTFLTNVLVFNLDTNIAFADTTNIKSVAVPLDRRVSGQTYVVRQGIVEDTISINYVPKENFISNGCGYQYYFQLQNVSHTSYSIDSVNITDANVNPELQTSHLEIIYK